MKLINYEFKEEKPAQWILHKFELGDVNLLACPSAVGKSRILNTIHNLSLMIKNKCRDLEISNLP